MPLEPHSHPKDECGVKDCRWCRHHLEDFHDPFSPHWHEGTEKVMIPIPNSGEATHAT